MLPVRKHYGYQTYSIGMSRPSRPSPERARQGAHGSSTPHGCPVGELMRFLGKPYVLELLHVFQTSPGAHRFVDLQRRLQVAPNTLSDRLRDLVEAGLLTRTAYNEIPPRVDYASTPKAEELGPIFEAMQRWAKGNDLRPLPRPMTAVTTVTAAA